MIMNGRKRDMTDGSVTVLQSIVDLLVAAGYTRAQVSSIAPFDKLTGGLAWCITGCNVDVDIDLFYDNISTPDQKLKVGKAIEEALQMIECPHPLQVHQIQGLDYPAVYLVVQWLVKHASTQEKLHNQSSGFTGFLLPSNKSYKLAQDAEIEFKLEEKEGSELFLETKILKERIETAGAGKLVHTMLPLLEQTKMSQEEELSFQLSCKLKHTELLTSIRNLEVQNNHSKEGDNHKVDVENVLQQNAMRLKLLSGDLATKNQNFMLYRRKLDEVPTHSELMQYEQCFVELYIHIQEKLRETRKHFTTYNALAEASELMLKEISLLNSIHAQFEEVVTSQGGRTKFVVSMSNIAKGVSQKVEKMEARFLAEQKALSALKKRYSQLFAERRRYEILMRLFQEECARNEVLRSSLQCQDL